MRILDKEKIDYDTKSYDYTEEDLSGVHAAAALGYDADMVFKTIITKGDKTGPVVFCLPSEKGNRFESSGPCKWKQECRNDSCQGTSGSDGVYPGRMLTDWNEERISYIY